MNILLKSIYITISLILVSPLISYTQSNATSVFTNTELISAAKEIMNASTTCALVSLDEEGRARVRAMDPFAPEDDLIVWFGTNSKSRKVEQINKDPRVTLYYLDSDASGYVMIYGIAELVDDPEEKNKHWKQEWEAFYPNKAENYLLVKVSPIWIEVSSTKRGIVSDTVTWQPPIVLFDLKKN